MLRHILFGISLLLLLLSSSCSIFFTPLDPQSEEERFERFPAGPYPVEQPVQIYWNPHKVPYIEAQNDADLAFGFGLVSAHLRMGQMEFLRRISQFRFSEMGGPVFVPTLDRTFQTIHAPISIEELYADLPAESRVWAENFVKGVNYYLRNTPEDELPKEYSILDWEKEYWKREDILRIGRAVSADLNWGLYALWLQQETPEQAKAVWARVLESGARSVASFDGNLETQALQKLLWENGRSGSNTVVVSGEKTSTGAAIMANDPHLGVTAPNIWLIVGLKSPTYHTVGLTIPGTAVIGVGRNPDIAWGGTNMRGVSSHLFEVTEDDIIGSKQVTIRKRWWFDEEYSIRLSTKGPVLTDVPFFEREDGKMFAIYWTGQEPSDELTAYLQASRARNWDEFKQAFESYSIFALNMLYADTAGNIGMLPGYRQPVLADMSEFALPIKSRSNRVTKVRKVSELPAVLNPSSGFLASSNNKPFSTDYPLAYSYSNDDRRLGP
jgi:penicillin amidase